MLELAPELPDRGQRVDVGRRLVVANPGDPGNRRAKPEAWRVERMITSKATSTTIAGSTTR